MVFYKDAQLINKLLNVQNIEMVNAPFTKELAFKQKNQATNIFMILNRIFFKATTVINFYNAQALS